jgi:hypothetical protein
LHITSTLVIITGEFYPAMSDNENIPTTGCLAGDCPFAGSA